MLKKIAKIGYNLVSSDLDKTELGQELPGNQTEFDLDLKKALTVTVKLLNLSNIAVTLLLMGRFDLYLDEGTLMTKVRNTLIKLII